MAQVVLSRNAGLDLERLHRFLAEKNPDAARRAMRTIRDKLRALEQFPRLGPADPDRPGTRQFFLPDGAAGYVARYEVQEDTVVVLAIRHMREAGYGDETPTPPPRAPSSRRRPS
jgi:plasmid stabilization system protein ParE